MTSTTTRGLRGTARGAASWSVRTGRYGALGIVAMLVALEGPLPVRMSAATVAPRVFISEVHPAGSGNGTYNADWFEVTNTGTTEVDITGWKMDDNSNSFSASVPLSGVTKIAPGQSVIFIDSSTPVNISAFTTAWFGSNVPSNFAIGTYGGSGVGLSTSGDAVNLFDASGTRITGVSFGAISGTATLDNTAGLGSPTLPLPSVSTSSVAGVNGAFLSANGLETGSPGKRLNASPLSTVDLSLYVRVGRYDLPEPTRTTPPANSLLAQEVSAVTYNWDTDSLFVVGDGGTSIVQVSKTGELIDSMTLAPGSSPQGTTFYDTEGLSYVGGGKFVMAEERDRQIVLFTYVPGTTLVRSATQTVKLGTFVDNIGIEGVSSDPLTHGFIAVKETQPEGIFQTGIDFAAGTATNGSPSTENSTNLFNPALANLLDFADVFALSNLSSLSGPESSHLLILSQESGRIVNIDLSGNISSSLTIVSDPGNPLNVAGQQHEGVTMDGNGFLYVVSENGGGDINHPQLWVYAPSSVPNQAPTAVVLNNQVNSIAENTNTAAPIKVADITVTDDGLGMNNLTVTGPDAGFFDVDSVGLYIKAGTTLDFETKSTYNVTVNVDDPTVGTNPDATASFTLTVTDVVNENPALSTLIISEVSPWGSGNSPYAADWFEVTNTGTSDVNIVGWRMDDNSNSFGSSVALRGLTNIPAGKSAIFFEGNATGSTDAAIVAGFSMAWFGSPTPPAGFLIGAYGGSGVGLSTSGDAVNLFDSVGNRITGVSFGASPAGPFPTFDNTAGLGSTTLPLPTISNLSVAGVNGAFAALSDPAEIGSPGAVTPSVIISEVAPWASGNAPYAADWFEVTNIGTIPVTITGWRMDDNSNSFGSSVPLRGVTTIPAGRSAVFLESDPSGVTDAAIIAGFLNAWLGSPTPPASFLIGAYGGSGVGLSTGGDAINLFDAAGNRLTGINFGSSTASTGLTFDNAAGLGSSTLPLPTVSTVSVAGVHGTFLAVDRIETGSPGTITSVQVTRGGFVRDRRTGTFAQQLTLTNASSIALAGPIFVVLDNVSVNASLVNASGTTTLFPPVGSPYVQVPGSSGGLGAGASLTVVVQFSNPTNSAITYAPRVLNGVAAP